MRGLLSSLNKIFEKNGSSVFIIITFVVTSFTIFGGSKYILMMTSWNNHVLRNKIEGDMFSMVMAVRNTTDKKALSLYSSHLYKAAKFGEKREHTPEEEEVDRVIKCLTIIIELNMVTTALSILTTLGLFCVMSKSMELNKKRANAVLPFMIWNSIAVLYNVIILVFMSVHLQKWFAKLETITRGVIVVGAADFIFIVAVAFYYRYLCNLHLPPPSSVSSPALLLRFQTNGNVSTTSHILDTSETDDLDEVPIPREMLDGILTRDRRLSIQKKNRNDSTF